MAASDCIESIRRAFKGKRNLSDDDIEFIIDEVMRRSGELGLGDDAFRQAALDVANEVREAAFIERRNRRLNIAAKQRLLSITREADKKFNDPSVGLEAAMVGINRPLREGRLSADARGQALQGQYMGGLIADLEQSDLLTHLNGGHMDIEIARALEKITKPEANGSTNKTATQIADLIHKHRKVAFDRQNRAGAWVKPLKGFITRQSHDMDKLRRAGFEEWRDFVLPLLDEARTFQDRSDTDTFLKEAWSTLATGQQHRALGGENDLRLAFSGPGNLAKRLAQHRVIHFKNADAWFRYNERFGLRNLREAIVSEFGAVARNTALMETFGTNPRSMFDEVRQALAQEFRGEPKKIDRLNRRIVQAQFDVVEGLSRIPVTGSLAKISSAVRAVQSLSKLGGAVLSSIADIGNKAAAIRYTDGSGVLTPIVESVTTAFEGLSGKDKRIAAELLGVGLDGQIGDMAARFSADDSIVGVGNQAMRLFFKLNLLTPWTDGNKRGMGLLLSRRLAMAGKQSFDDMPDRLRFLLEGFGINANHWDVARQVVRRADDGNEYLFPDEIRNLESEVFTRAGLDPVTDRDFVETALRAFIVDTTEAAVPTPGARERAMLTLGLRPGTPEGEAIRLIAQFKAFPVTVATKTLGRIIYSNPDGKADKVGLAMFLASTTILGYAAMVAKDLSKGRTPRDPLDRSTLIAAMTQGGGFGIYGDFLLGETNRFGRSLLDTIAGPTLGAISDIDELRARLIAGDDVAAAALRIATQQTPFVNLFYARGALDYLFLYHLQEAVNPGYLRRTERRLKREQNQTFILPPSQVVPRGGDLFAGSR